MGEGRYLTVVAGQKRYRGNYRGTEYTKYTAMLSFLEVVGAKYPLTA